MALAQHTQLAVIENKPGSLAARVTDEDVADVLRGARSDKTLADYTRAYRAFADWCASEGVPAINPDRGTVARYLVGLSKRIATTGARKGRPVSVSSVTLALYDSQIPDVPCRGAQHRQGRGSASE